MRTQPINIYLAEPCEVLNNLTIVIPDVGYMSVFESNLYCNGSFLVLSDKADEMVRDVHKVVKRGANIVLTTKGWRYEREFLTVLRDYLEMVDDVDDLYIIPTTVACQIFGDVSVNMVADPALANGYVPSNDEDDGSDLLKIADMFDYNEDYDIPDDEAAATLTDYLDVDGNGFILVRNKSVGNICNIPLRYTAPGEDEVGPCIILRNDPLYIPESRFREDDEITFSGNYQKMSGSMYSNLEDLDLGRFGLVYCKMLDKYYHIVDGKEPVFVMSVGNRVELSKHGSTTGTVIDRLVPTTIHTNIGLLFARCAARDKRRVFDLDAYIYYDGRTCPITWLDDSKGGYLTVGSCRVDKKSYEKFMEVVG